MNGILKKTIFVFAFLLAVSCKNKEILNSEKYDVACDGKNLVAHNINTLIDSVGSFDLRFLVKDSKEPPLTVGLIDSMAINGKSVILENKITKNYLSSYKLNLVKRNNYDANVLFITFLNFRIQGDQASIEVKKIFGISMMQVIFYFKKEHDTWVFVRKRNFGAIG